MYSTPTKRPFSAVVTPTAPSKRSKKSSTAAQIRRTLLNTVETKTNTITGSHFSGGASSTSSAVALTSIGLGSSATTRNGNKILVTRIEAKLFTQTCGSTRVLLFCPRDPALTWDATRDIRTFNYSPDDIWVFYDKVHGSEGLATSTTPNGVININMKRNQHVQWNAAGTIIKNPIYMAFLPVNGASASASVQGYIRLYYKDL